MISPTQSLAELVIGTVDSVSPIEIVVSLANETPQAIALNTGTPTPFPRINGYVLLPNEAGATVAYVTWIGTSRATLSKAENKTFGLIDLPFPSRKMVICPIGTLILTGNINSNEWELSRGVRAFPSVGDQVLLPTVRQVAAIVGAKDEDRRVKIGTSPLAMDADVMVDPDKIFGRHLAVLGNTGSGKSCSVAGLIRWSLDAAKKQRKVLEKSERPNARFIILDPNGEYQQAFSDDEQNVRVFRVPPVASPEKGLRVPAWLWNGLEWSILTHAQPGVQRPLLRQGLRELKSGTKVESGDEHKLFKSVHAYLTSITSIRNSGLNGYSAFPGKKNFGETLKNLVKDLSYHSQNIAAETATLANNVIVHVNGLVAEKCPSGQHWSAFSETDLINVEYVLQAVLLNAPQDDFIALIHEDTPIPFDITKLSEHLEELAQRSGGNVSGFTSSLGLRIRSMLGDARLASVVGGDEDQTFSDWLIDYIGGDEAVNGNVAVVDLSLVPSELVHIIVSVLSRVVFEALQRYRRDNGGETLPTVLVLEEAHNFVKGSSSHDTDGWGASDLCRDVFERIAREGRKFGLGLLVSSQRPSELSPTLLAQCNTFLLHRIVNDADQRLVSKLVPDNIGGLLSELSSLPSKHAILLGWATSLPLLVEMQELQKLHQPRSADPSYWDVWTGKLSRGVKWNEVAAHWVGVDNSST